MRALPLLVLLAACPPAENTASDGTTVSADAKAEAKAFLDGYTTEYVRLYTAWQEAEWAANTRIVEGDDTAVDAAAAAHDAYAKHTGSVEVIETAKRLLGQREQLDPMQVRELEQVLFNAAGNPQTIPDVVKRRIDAEGQQVQKLYGYEFTLDGKPLTPNEIDEKLQSSVDLAERLKVWEASKAIGPTLKPGLVELRDLRNQSVRALGYDDFYGYQISAYGMTTAEMDELMLRVQRELRPLYRELHTWVRYELAEKYHQPVPDQIPAHWLPNRWGQDWSGLVEVEGADIDAALAKQTPEQMVRSAEDFYVSLGFSPLPASFYEKSSLYPVPEGSAYKKNTHASAWHMDLDQDVRSLMSVEANAEWYETTHHELGHVYYYVSYTRPDVPPLLREGANRAFHEAVGSQMGFAAMQRPFLESRGLIAKEAEVDDVQLLLREALANVVFIPFAAGTMASYERALYADELSPDQFNAKWWELAGKYQGIAPPSARGEEFADALSKTHISDDPAQYYDYALSYVLLFQLHEHIAKEILKQDPHATNYYGRKDVGDWLKSLLEPGATRDWRELTREKTGRDMTAEPMVAYFEPLVEWLKKENEGRVHTLPEI